MNPHTPLVLSLRVQLLPLQAGTRGENSDICADSDLSSRQQAGGPAYAPSGDVLFVETNDV